MNKMDIKKQFNLFQSLLIQKNKLIVTIAIFSFALCICSCDKESDTNDNVGNVVLTLQHGYHFANAYFDSVLPNANVGLILTEDVPNARTVSVYDNFYSFEELKGLIRYTSHSDNEGIANFTGVNTGEYYPLVYRDNEHYHLVCTYIHYAGSNFYVDVVKDSTVYKDVISSSIRLNDYYSGIQTKIFWRTGGQWNPGDTTFLEGVNVALLTFRPESVSEAKNNALRIEKTDASGTVLFDNLGSPHETYYIIVYFNETDYCIPSDAYNGIYPGFNKDAIRMFEVDENELGIFK